MLTESSGSNLENNEGTERLLRSQRGAGRGEGGDLVYKDGFEKDPESDTEEQVIVLHTAERSDPRGPA